MEPNIPDGSIVVIDKRIDVLAGDFAAIWTDRGVQIFEMQLAPPPEDMWEGTEEFDAILVVNQMKPREQFKISTKKVKAVHKIIGFQNEDGTTYPIEPNITH